LLAATCACAAADATAYVGIAGDELLRKKKHAELLEPFETRRANVVAYLRRCRPALRVETSALLDPKAPPKVVVCVRFLDARRGKTERRLGARRGTASG